MDRYEGISYVTQLEDPVAASQDATVMSHGFERTSDS